MYDSENISFVTRVEAGTGVTVSHSTNSDGDSIWKADIDQTWLANWVNANSAGALKLNDSDEARIKALELKLGISTPAPAPAPSVPSGTAGTTEVTISANVAVLTDNINMIYGFAAADGTTVIDSNLIGGHGATIHQILQGIYSQMKRNNGMLRYMTPTYDLANQKLIITWKAENVGYTFITKVNSEGTGNGITFTATNY